MASRGVAKEISLAVEVHGSLIGSMEPSDDLDQCRLARTVLPDHRVDLACLEIGVDRRVRACTPSNCLETCSTLNKLPLMLLRAARPEHSDMCDGGGPAPRHAAQPDHVIRSGLTPTPAATPREGPTSSTTHPTRGCPGRCTGRGSPRRAPPPGRTSSWEPGPRRASRHKRQPPERRR